LESLADALLPPASAEHVLGDLAESSPSTPAYLRNLVSILPRVIWSQIRRRATLGGIVFNAMLTAFALVACQRFPKPPIFAEWIRLGAPWAIWVAGCALSSAYGPRDKPAWWKSRVLIATALATLASAAWFGVPLAGVIMALGVVFATLLMFSLPFRNHGTLAPLSLDTLSDHACLFQKMIWWRNARESLAAVVVLMLNTRDLWRADSQMARTGHALLIAGMLFIIWFLHVRAGSRAVPGHADTKDVLRFHQREIARQRDVLRAVPLWYLLPFVPGMIAIGASKWETSAGGALIGVPAIVGIFVLVWLLNAWGARWLDRQLHNVDALEGQL
jgi:hypothetical protein